VFVNLVGQEILALRPNAKTTATRTENAK
jgi:hypothetical protein